MTWTEVIKEIERMKAYGWCRTDVLDIAIESVKESYTNGCEGCKYMPKDQYEMPCLICKNSYKNLWCAE